jgi:hypothetical protein
VSTANISQILPVPGVGVFVTFETKRGSITYFYEGDEATVGILAGDDPKNYLGVVASED